VNLRRDANIILNAAIDAVRPTKLIRNQIGLAGNILRIMEMSIDLSQYENIYIIGAGKASAFMAQSLEEIVGDGVNSGVVVVKYDHGAPCQKIKVLEGGHPIIDENSLSGTEQILTLAQEADEEDLVFCLISGGGSALLERLPSGISLPDLQNTFKALLECGAAIEEINTVRKHLSLVKGGQLARAISPATCITLIISDVIGDPVESIASGPTAADPTTFRQTWQVIEKYKLADRLPGMVKKYLREGIEGKSPETLKPGDPIFNKTQNIVLGNNFLSLKNAEQAAQGLGYNTIILSSRIQGEAKEIARAISGMVAEITATGHPLARPACLLMGGETTVTIKGAGMGGRNQELVLSALLSLKNVAEPFLLVSCGTDGTDGPTDAAGGMISGETWIESAKLNLKPQKYLDTNDAYHFLEKVDGLIKTGPTGTNVMDIIFALIPKMNA
jgi:glycerate 2-kinase